ncbi:MAG: DEAD/DEAH box helicase, partial [Nitrosopumilus sp.]
MKNPTLDLNLNSLFSNFGFTNLTEIQKKASPVILQKKDCLVIAPTGSGKTECSVIPIFSIVKNSKKSGKIKVLYITPLRALNRDVFRRITKYAHNSNLSIEIRHGDTTQTARKKITE